MVAKQTIAGATVAVALARHADRLPFVGDDKKAVAIQAAVGIALILAGSAVKETGWVKTLTLSTGIGLSYNAASVYLGA